MSRENARPSFIAATAAALLLLCCCTVSESPAGEYLTPGMLAMPRREISFKGTDLRLFNARVSLTFRERTVTGIAELFIAPRAASRVPVSFNLSFCEEAPGALIGDNQDEWGEGTLNVWQHWNPANKELGIYKGWGDALILPSQRATWAPDAYPRRGTSHHYRMEEPERAWDVLSRCLLWVDRFPYFPQTIYTEELAMQEHERGWSLQISAGAGAQAIIHGVFGLMPQDDGSLALRPHYNKSLDTASLNGYRFRDHLYDFRMDAKTFQVFRDGVLLAEERHGKDVTITEQGEVRRDKSALPSASSAESAKPPSEVNAEFCPAIARVELDRERVSAGQSVQMRMGWRANVATGRDYQLSLNLVGIGRPPDFSTNLVLRPPTSRWEVGELIRQEEFTLTIPTNLSPGWRRLLFSLTEPGVPDRAIPLDNADRHERNSQYCFGEIEILPAGSNVPGEPVVRLPTNDPAKPERPNEEWRMRHGERVADVRSHADNLDVIFIGDSITGGWLNVGKAVWEKEIVPLRAVNIGIAGSQTSHILWQFENGAIDGINPRLAVLMIGVNNVMAAPSQSAADIARGVTAIVTKLREKLPHTKVLLLGTFPKDPSPTTPDRRKIQEINSLIAKLNDGKWIRFCDLSPNFVGADGALSSEISPDGVHLSAKGYQIWADAMRALLTELKADPSSSPAAPATGSL